MKNPIFAIGLLFMVIFLFQAGEKFNWWESRKKKLMPSSCKAVLVKLERRIPANWKAGCEGNFYNNLYVLIEFNASKKEELEATKEALQRLVYRELANNLISIALNSPEDNLEQTDIVRLQFTHPKLTVNAITQGKHVAKLQTLKDKRLIAEHLKSTVSVQEITQTDQ